MVDEDIERHSSETPLTECTAVQSDTESESALSLAKDSNSVVFDPPVFSETQFKKPKLLYAGHSYRVDRRKKDRTTWRCTVKGCNGRTETEGSKITRDPTSHSHAPDPAKNIAWQITRNIAVRGSSTSEPPRKLIHQGRVDVMKDLTPCIKAEVAIALPSDHALRLQIGRKRKQAGIPPAAKTAAEMFIPQSLRITLSNPPEPFLRYDSGAEDERRFLIFATDKNLQELIAGDHWFCDGTFSVMPTYLCQLYTIHGLKEGITFALVYVLMAGKSQAEYSTIFEEVVRLEPRLNPKTILCDFESATLKSCAEVFPEAKLTGCHFHLAHSIWRNIKDMPEVLALLTVDDEARLFVSVLTTNT